MKETGQHSVGAVATTADHQCQGNNMGIFDGTYVNVNCPNCNFELDVELTAVSLEETIFCPCCKIIIQLRDENASTHRAERNIDSALTDFRRSLRKLNRSMKL